MHIRDLSRFDSVLILCTLSPRAIRFKSMLLCSLVYLFEVRFPPGDLDIPARPSSEFAFLVYIALIAGADDVGIGGVAAVGVLIAVTLVLGAFTFCGPF